MIYKHLILLSFIICFTRSYAQNSNLILVEGGNVIYKNEKEIITSFKISKYEVTNLEYAAFLNAVNIKSDGIYNAIQIINTNSPDLQLTYQNKKWVPKANKENFPVVMVNYYGALAYCKWAKGNLPTELEWYYAASGGNKSNNYIYSGSDNLNEVGWYSKNSNSHSQNVGTKKPNELGIYDMSGNAWEWCLNETLKNNADFCLHMGGSWFAEKQPSSILANYGNIPIHYSNSVGFRIVFPMDEDY